MPKYIVTPFKGETNIPPEIVGFLKEEDDKLVATVISTRKDGYVIELQDGVMYNIVSEDKHKVGELIVFDKEGNAIETMVEDKPEPTAKRQGCSKQLEHQAQF